MIDINDLMNEINKAAIKDYATGYLMVDPDWLRHVLLTHGLGVPVAAGDKLPVYRIAVWNDAPGRTKDEVLAAFDRAIALAEHQEAALSAGRAS